MKRLVRTPAVFWLTAALLFGGCSSAPLSPHWSYDGEAGPAHWAELAAAYETCGAGREQSPIDLTVTANETDARPAIAYGSSALKAVNNGHTIEFSYDPGSSLTVGGRRFELLQFHFHSPSEHSVDSVHSPLEFHFVHRSGDGRLAVLGILVKEGKEHEAFARWLDDLPYEAGATRAREDLRVDARAMLPSTERFFHYAGSLTTPPCSENVAWFVLREPIEMSRAQIAAFEKAYAGNNRPVTPLHRRTLFVR